jgi:superfamily II DNA or RNA helicase
MRHTRIRATLARLLVAMLASGDHPFRFYPFQQETLEKFVKWLRQTPKKSDDPKLSHRTYVDQATGLGKTEQFMAMIRAAAGKLRVLVIVPNKPLVVQTVRRIAKTTNGRLGHVSSSRAKIVDEKGEIISLKGYHDHDIVVTTDESFKSRAKDLARTFNPDLIIWDECHWAYSELAQKSLAEFPEAVVVGFSATPDYLGTVAKAHYAPVTLDNGQVLYGDPDRFARTHFGECLDKRGVRWGIENGFLAPFAWGRIEFKVSLKGIPTVRNAEGIEDYDPGALHKLLAKHWKSMMKVIRKLYQSGQYDLKKRSAVAICPDVAQAQALANSMNGIGVPSECVHAGTDDEARERIFADFKAGKIKLITSVFVLREGWDMPKAEVCLMLRPTRSRVLYIQFMGRVLRLDLDNPDKVALVLDPFFQDADFAPLSAPMLFGLPGQEIHVGGIVIGPKGGKRGGKKLISPYEIDHLAPVLVIERPEIDYRANESGSVIIDGVEYMTVRGYAARVNSSTNVVQSRIDQHGLKARAGKDSRGHDRPLYATRDLDPLFPEGQRTKADRSGRLLIRGQECKTLGRYAKDRGIREPLLQRGIQEHNVQPMPGRVYMGRERPFYPVKVLDRIFANVKPKADRQGILIINEKPCMAARRYAARMGFEEKKVKGRISEFRLKGEKRRNYKGRECLFYPLADLDRLFADMIARRKKRLAKR